jgi:hypothetical protein
MFVRGVPLRQLIEFPYLRSLREVLVGSSIEWWIVLMFSVNRRQVKGFFASFSVLVVLAGVLFGARVAAADSVWVQSYERTGQTQPCVAQPGETPWQSSWGTDSSWTPSWEQWANNGRGGWTCTRSITWARDSAARTYALGDIGPGGGLVFLISGGLTYEMAPKTWSGTSSDDTPLLTWCSNTTSDISGAVGTAVGTGSANTTAMQSPACTSGAGVSARAYRGGGLTDWFLPSLDELNAMCNYSQNPTTPRTGVCTGAQDGTFSTGAYGFASDGYWSSSQGIPVNIAMGQIFNDGSRGLANKSDLVRLRPVRAF